jgi:hypothetical protein
MYILTVSCEPASPKQNALAKIRYLKSVSSECKITIVRSHASLGRVQAVRGREPGQQTDDAVSCPGRTLAAGDATGRRRGACPWQGHPVAMVHAEHLNRDDDGSAGRNTGGS